jgi:hypothetical protein
MIQTTSKIIQFTLQLRTALVLLLPLLVIVNGIIWRAYTMLNDQQWTQWVMQAERGLDAASLTFKRERNNLHSDLLLLANSPTLKAALDELTADRLDRLAAEWEVHAAILRRYDQIRWLDSQGKERLRINLTPQGATRVSDSQLQDKSHRYYFKEAITLPAGHIYASPIDLNIEHGEIDRPYKPMLRLAAPVTNSRGERRGMVLVNVLAEYIIEDLAHYSGFSHSHLLMIEPSGYYLRGFHKSQEWGFMFQLQDDTDYRFDKRYPLAWRQMVQKGTGRIETPQGAFMFRTLNYGTHSFAQRYFLLAVMLSDDMERYRADQRQLWLPVSVVVSLILTLLSLSFSYYMARCAEAKLGSHGV